MSKVSFVLPFYNEEESLPLLIARIHEVMKKENEEYELVFVNDASTDNSADVIAEQSRKPGTKGKMVLVNMSRRFGVEESFLAGIQVASGDAVILMYTDMQDPPEVVHEMLKRFRGGAEIVHTIRRKRMEENPLKSVAAFLAYRLIGKLATIDIPYDAGEFKLLSREAARHLLDIPEASPYLRGLIPWLGFKQETIPYDMEPRKMGRRKVPLFGAKAFKLVLNGIISFSDLPIYLILMTGIGGIVAAIVLAVLSPVWPHLIGWSGLVFLWATLMAAIGILSLYALKIYKVTSGRPRYIIQKVIRFGTS